MISKIYRLLSRSWVAVTGRAKAHRQLAAFYKNREWDDFDRVLSKINASSIVRNYWAAMRSAYFMQLIDPVSKWQDIHDRCRKQHHFLSQLSFRNYVSALIETGDLIKLEALLKKHIKEYTVRGILLYLQGICALYIHKKKYVECIEFLSMAEKLPMSYSIRYRFRLKAYPYQIMCKAKVDGRTLNGNEITQGLIAEMQPIYKPGSPAKAVLDACLASWETIDRSDAKQLTDLRYNELQLRSLRSMVKQAIVDKEPLALLRLGDGESYGFASSDPNHADEIISAMEDFWWDNQLPKDLRDSITKEFLDTVRSADIIGLPYTIRLSQTLYKLEPGSLSFSDIRQLVLFKGVKDAVENGLACSMWTDEYCNYAFVDTELMRELIDLSGNVVLVTCFNIPRKHVFDSEKVTVIHAPPVKKVAYLDNTTDNSKSLPEVIHDLKMQVAPHLKPGTIALISAGFAGKPLLKQAKDAGAVAIDYGSSIDHMLGYRTRNQELHTLFDDRP